MAFITIKPDIIRDISKKVFKGISGILSILLLGALLFFILSSFLGSILYNKSLEWDGILFFGFLILLILSLVLLLSWKIESVLYRKILRILLFILSSTFAAYIMWSALLSPSSLFAEMDFMDLFSLLNEALDKVGLNFWGLFTILYLIFFWIIANLGGIIMFLIYGISLYALSRKDWYPNMLIIVGFILTLALVIYCLIFLSIALNPTAYNPDYPYDEHKFLFRNGDTSEYLLRGGPIMLVYLLYPLLVLTLGCVRKINKPGWWNKLPKYEIIAMVLLILIYWSMANWHY